VVVIYLLYVGGGLELGTSFSVRVLTLLRGSGLVLASIMLGLAVAAGLAEPRRKRSDGGGDVGPELGPPGAQL
jgi:hypothetical protein